MNTCLVYPSALGNLHLSDAKRMFQVVPVTVSKISDRRINDTHWHDYLQIWYTVSGSYLHTVGGVTYEEKPGSAMLIFPYTKHSIDSSCTNLDDATVIKISVKKDALEKNSIPFLPHGYNNASFNSFNLNPHILFSGKDKEAADRICMDLLSEYNKRTAMHFSKLLSSVADFLELCANRSEKRCSKREISTIQSRNTCINEAMAFLVDNSKKRITLTDASNAAMMSRRNFTASFYTVTGQSCRSYINALRMYNAVCLLRWSEKSISEIAEECGYFDSSHFWRQCVEILGTSPLALRRELSQWTREYGDKLFQRTVRNYSWAIPFGDDIWDRHSCAMSFY